MNDAPTNNGVLLVMVACNAQKPLPITDKSNIDIDTSRVCFDFITFIICGSKIKVQKADASQP